MNALQDLQPQNVFYYFEEISKIPHGSGHTEAISEYVADFAKKHGLSYIKDEMGNVIIKKSASKGFEDRPTVILEGHVDMVLEKEKGNTLDLLNDGLVLGIDGDYIHANGTTLGADDGAAVAFMMALLAGDYEHPALECVFTVDEEIGLLGAAGLDCSNLSGKVMINIDSEEEGIFTVGCAGGIAVHGTLPVRRFTVEADAYELKVSGLLGGHSGMEIDKERANAMKLVGRVLHIIDQEYSFGLISMKAGHADNVIPPECACYIALDPEDEAAVSEVVSKLEETIRHEYMNSDPDIHITFSKAEAVEPRIVDPASKSRIIFLLCQVPNGLLQRSVLMKDLPETSANLGVVDLKDDSFTFISSVRSMLESEKMAVADQIIYLTEFLGGEAELHGKYPGWEFKYGTPLQKTMCDSYKKLFDVDPQIICIHGGLECGIFASRIPGLDCVSIGPGMKDIHSPMEKLSISSTQKVWAFLLDVLKTI